jgi:CRISPR/Cas system CSM-associated protein Csm4 (group 5 of RAMP superfamily)
MVTQQILSSQLSFTLGLYPTDSTFSAIIYSTLGLYPTDSTFSAIIYSTLGLYPTNSTFSAIIYSTLGLYPTDSTFSAIIYSGSLPNRFYLFSYHLLWVFTQQILSSQLSFTLRLYPTVDPE